MKTNRILFILAILLISGGSTFIFASMDESATNSTPYVKPADDLTFHKQLTSFDQTEAINEENKQVYPEPITPTHIEIPAIGVDASINATGLDDNNEMIVPDNGEDVAWFEPGSQPGSTGNAVLAGHVDDYTGPAVFFDLEDLNPGDEIIITDKKGESLTFVVDQLKSYPKDKAPLRQVFGPTNERSLNLVTCTGLYNQSIEEHEERLVVYTTLK
ncbi:class F sortase [Alkalibacillus almallahensis]|uniref:class F sortase n=1 Tax=Alkalibacillus almallahensis TaxID=1379154 RepID=UPI00141ED50A|nr:class F sortase [Alkalibacillus almallahensis]NIK12476.1 sortase (surface protein transpeptidase) [Alkalibacillus almallahensis]